MAHPSSRTAETSNAHAVKREPEPYAPEEKHARKRRILTHESTALVQSIANAIVLKNEDIFFLAEPDGSVPLKDHHGLGLYYHDCRFLNGYELRIGGSKPSALAATSARGSMAIFDLTNRDLRIDRDTFVKQESIGIHWVRTIDRRRSALEDWITFQNFALHEISFPVSLTFQAAFEDVFEVRGAAAERRGQLHEPEWEKQTLRFVYDGADGIRRGLRVDLAPRPDRTEGTTAHFEISLRPRETQSISLSLVIQESTGPESAPTKRQTIPDLKSAEETQRQLSKEWHSHQTEIRSDSVLVDRVLDRSLQDLWVLKSMVEKEEYFAAGVPWFVSLFGRDSLITAFQTLAYDPEIAAQTLRLLAKYQGQRVNDWRDEQPGKILHELRVGEMAHLDEIPQTPYYGSVDSTPLFLMLFSRFAAWTGDLGLFRELEQNVERALGWASRYGDLDGDGYVEYKTVSSSGLTNQGWKDSGDAIVNADASLAAPPIALVEVQGYLYAAKQGIADLYERAGDAARAEALRREAKELYERFNRDFWLKDDGFYALALQDGGKPAAVVSSNPGQALWAGIIAPQRAKQTVERLMAEDMFSGWGIRTLSEKEKRYNPIGYHLGTVWPHDNSLIMAGLRQYGFDAEARQLFRGIVEAAVGFPLSRLPELFAGFRREDYDQPVRYPVACHPQAWAAGAVPYMLTTLLGLVPEAFEHRLRIVRPILPDWIDHLQVRRLRVGSAHTDLSFEKSPDGAIAVKVLGVEGPLEVVVEPNVSSE